MQDASLSATGKISLDKKRAHSNGNIREAEAPRGGLVPPFKPSWPSVTVGSKALEGVFPSLCAPGHWSRVAPDGSPPNPPELGRKESSSSS